MATVSLTNASNEQLIAELKKRVDATSTIKVPLAQRIGNMRADEIADILNPAIDAYKKPQN